MDLSVVQPTPPDPMPATQFFWRTATLCNARHPIFGWLESGFASTPNSWVADVAKSDTNTQKTAWRRVEIHKLHITMPVSTRSILSPSAKSRSSRDGDCDSVITACTGDSRDQSLRPTLLKQLAEDIEKSGGIEQFIGKGKKNLLAKLLDSNIQLYGIRGDPLRRKIQDKVYYWQKIFAKGKYVSSVLQKLGVDRGAGKSLPKIDSTIEEADVSDLESSSSDFKSEERPHPRPKPSPPQIPPETPQDTLKSSPPQVPPEAPKDTLKMSESPSKNAIPRIAQYIKVDTEIPENNREVFVFTCSNLEGKGAYKDRRFDGHFVCFPVDARLVRADFKTTFYSARVIPPNKLLCKFPSVPYALMNNEDRTQLNAALPQGVSDALDVRRNDFIANYDSRKFKYIVLVFPETIGNSEVPVHLTSHPIYEEAGEDEECEFKLLPVKYRKNEAVDWATSEKPCQVCNGTANLAKEFWGGFTVAMKAAAPNLGGEVKAQAQSENAKLLSDLGGFLDTKPLFHALPPVVLSPAAPLPQPQVVTSAAAMPLFHALPPAAPLPQPQVVSSAAAMAEHVVLSAASMPEHVVLSAAAMPEHVQSIQDRLNARKAAKNEEAFARVTAEAEVQKARSREALRSRDMWEKEEQESKALIEYEQQMQRNAAQELEYRRRQQLANDEQQKLQMAAAHEQTLSNVDSAIAGMQGTINEGLQLVDYDTIMNDESADRKRSATERQATDIPLSKLLKPPPKSSAPKKKKK